MDLRKSRLEAHYYCRKLQQRFPCGYVLRIQDLWVLLRVWNFVLCPECDPYLLWRRTFDGNRSALHQEEGGLNWLDGYSLWWDESSELKEPQHYDIRRRRKAFCDGMSRRMTSE